MSVVDLFVGKAKQRVWKRLAMDHVVRNATALTDDGTLVGKDEAYVTLRMRQMYLRDIRVLWRKYYPMLHGFVSYRDREEHVLAGPSQLSQLGEANLDRVVVSNQRLGGPLAYMGGDVTLLTGLYSVPGEDAAKVLLDTLGNMAALPGVSLGTAPQLANVVKAGVESILKLNELRLELGVKDSFYAGNPLRAGYYVAMNASEDEVALDRLWLLETGLKVGDTPIDAKNYDKHDYMVIEIERIESRDDWPSLPGFKAIQDKFATVMSDGTLDREGKRARLKVLWPEFYTLLTGNADLITADRQRVADSVKAQLNAQLEAGGNPFETRSWGGAKRVVKPGGFDLLDVSLVDRDGSALSPTGF